MELPHAAFPVKLQCQLLIRLVSPYDVQQGGIFSTPLLLHDERSIRCTQQVVGAGDHVKAVFGFHLPGVVNHQQADAVLVAESFQLGHDLVVAGVTVSFTADFPHLLQGIDDDEPHIWMLPNEAFQLLVKSLAHGLCLCRKVQIAGLLYPEHPGEPPLQPGVIVLQCQVEDGALMHLVLPQRKPHRHMVGKLPHEEGLTHLGRTYKEVGAAVQQVVHDGSPGWIHRVVQFGH